MPFEDAFGFLEIVHAENHRAAGSVEQGRGVGVFDVDLMVGQRLGDRASSPGWLRPSSISTSRSTTSTPRSPSRCTARRGSLTTTRTTAWSTASETEMAWMLIFSSAKARADRRQRAGFVFEE